MMNFLFESIPLSSEHNESVSKAAESARARSLAVSAAATVGVWMATDVGVAELESSPIFVRKRGLRRVQMQRPNHGQRLMRGKVSKENRQVWSTKAIPTRPAETATQLRALIAEREGAPLTTAREGSR